MTVQSSSFLDWVCIAGLSIYLFTSLVASLWFYYSLALVFALTHFVVKVHLDLQYELQLLVGHKRGQGAVDPLTSVHGLPVVLVPQVHFVAAGRLLVVMPPTGAFLCGHMRML